MEAVDKLTMEPVPTLKDERKCSISTSADCDEEVHTVTVTSKNIQEYWVKFKGGKIEIGCHGKDTPFLSYGECTKKNVTEPEVTEVKPHTKGNPVAVWKKYDGLIPEDAVYAGNDQNCALFVGRAHHDDDLLPGKVCLANKICYVSKEEKEFQKTQYEVLTGKNFSWVPFLNNEIFKIAVPGGHTKEGIKMYIGRALYNDTLSPGRVDPVKEILFLPYGNKEHQFKGFEILVFQ